jgi:hypothetical protein
LSGIKVKFLSYKQIGEIANKVLVKYNYSEIIPVPIEELIDNDLRINTIPISGLTRTFDINAITSSNLKTIIVDEYLFQSLDKQYRFTLAHELGHIILHQKIYKEIDIGSLDDWKKFINKVDEREYRYLEIQADNFAGHILVPQKNLEYHLKRQLKIWTKSSLAKRFPNLKPEDSIDLTAKIIAGKLSPIFDVSPQVVEIRIKKSSLVRQIS